MGPIERVEIRSSVLSAASQLDHTAEHRSACRRKLHVQIVRGYVILRVFIDLIADDD